MRIGFIGTGNMGSRMAARILEAFPLTVYDRNRASAEPLLNKGAAGADSPREAAAASDVLFTCLPGPPEFEECLAGILEGLAPGSVLVDHTTNAPLLVRKAAGLLAAKGCQMLDAPVSGGVSGAGAGTLTVQVGGDAATLDRVRPVIEKIAKNIVHVGGPGAGCIAKIAHNCAVFGANLAMLECMTMAVKAGIEPGVIIELFQKSGIGRNHDLQVSLPVTLFQGDFAPRFAMTTALKDIRLATELAQAVGVPMAVAQLCEHEMAEAVRRGWGGRDHAVYLTLQEERAGVQVRAAGAAPQPAKSPDER